MVSVFIPQSQEFGDFLKEVLLKDKSVLEIGRPGFDKLLSWLTEVVWPLLEYATFLLEKLFEFLNFYGDGPSAMTRFSESWRNLVDSKDTHIFWHQSLGSSNTMCKSANCVFLSAMVNTAVYHFAEKAIKARDLARIVQSGRDSIDIGEMKEFSSIIPRNVSEATADRIIGCKLNTYAVMHIKYLFWFCRFIPYSFSYFTDYLKKKDR